jgi:hypothetical protein
MVASVACTLGLPWVYGKGCWRQLRFPQRWAPRSPIVPIHSYIRTQRFGTDPDHLGCFIALECHRLAIGQAPDGGKPSQVSIPCSPVDGH